jgi:mono/diheme cytochrome c family protein
MLIRIRCQHCGFVFKVHARSAGKTGACPNPECRQSFVVPTLPMPVDEPTPVVVQPMEQMPAVRSQESGVRSQESTRSNRPAKRVAPDVLNISEFHISPVKEPGLRARKSTMRRNRQARQLWWIGAVSAAVLVGIVAIAMNFNSPGVTHTASQASADDEPPAPVLADFKDEIQPFFQQYCYDCHGPDSMEEGLDFSSYADLAAVQSNRETWEKVYELVRFKAMPPSDMPQPTDAEREAVVSYLNDALFYVDCDANPDPGRVTIRRLNRTEYNNTIRDLLGVDFQPADSFPSDDVGYGFDNIGEVLSVPPLLIEKYLDAAEQVAAKALPFVSPEDALQHIAASELEGSGSTRDRDGMKRLNSRGAVFHEFSFAMDGDYIIRIEASAEQAGDEPAKMEIEYGGRSLEVVEIQGEEERQVYEVRLEAEEGRRRVSAAFINDYYNAEAREDRNMSVGFIEVEGPLGVEGGSELAERLLAVRPDDSLSSEDAAHQNLKPFLARAFRRPVTDAEVAEYTRFVTMAMERGETFERGTQVALTAALVSPHFLFRVESTERPDDPTARTIIDDHELACRLSYFLWSTMPDDELFSLAQTGRLHQEDVLRQQVERMLADSKSDQLVANFAGQWLGLRKLTTNEVEPDAEIFPEFTDELRLDMWKETELFFGSIVHEDRSILDLLDAPHTFLNERLAKHYGIEGVEGEEFRKVDLNVGGRAGLLTHASILTLTSYPTRTSPVKRGQWILENILDEAPPPPPPVVPALEETQEAHPDLSFREQLVLHRSDPGCASCHIVMDDIGFGFENFNAVGQWRDSDGEHELDTSGSLPTGETFSGPMELIEILQERKDQFAECLTEKLMIYALGRGLEYYDACAVAEVLELARQRDYRFSALIEGIVLSDPFRVRRGDEGGE